MVNDMKNPILLQDSVAASGTSKNSQSIALVKARTMSLTCRLTCGAALNADPTVQLYTSPDGEDWDTETYTDFDLAHTASATIQRTALIDVPEDGYILANVLNNSAADTLEKVTLWYTLEDYQTNAEVNEALKTLIEQGSILIKKAR